MYAGQSVCSTHCGSTTSSTSDILVLPKPKVPQKKRQAVNSKASCITDTEVFEQLKAKEREKVQKEEEKRLSKLKRQRKLERQRKKAAQSKEQSKRRRRMMKQPKRCVKPTTRRSEKALLEHFQSLSLDSASETSQNESNTESEAECPKCGLVYGEDDSVWIQCDNCGLWWDMKCSGVSDVENIPDIFFCETCS